MASLVRLSAAQISFDILGDLLSKSQQAFLLIDSALSQCLISFV